MSNHPNTPIKPGGGFSVPRATSKPLNIPKPPEKQTEPPRMAYSLSKEDTSSNFFSNLRLTDTPANFSSYRQTARRKESLRRLNDYEEKHLGRMKKYEDMYGNKSYLEKLGLPHTRVDPTRAGPLARNAPRHNNGESMKPDSTTDERNQRSIKCSIQLKEAHEKFVNTFLKK